MEEWREIPGTNGTYSVSNEGRVRSEDRVEYDKNGRGVTHKGQHIAGMDNGSGYYKVTITQHGKRKRFYVHRLVAEAFCEKPKGCDQVNHKDFNPGNNRADNLEWVTNRQNFDYSWERGRFRRTEQWVSRLRSSLEEKMGMPVIGERISDGETVLYSTVNGCRVDGFQPSCVSCCCNGKRMSHKGYIWRFADGSKRL